MNDVNNIETIETKNGTYNVRANNGLYVINADSGESALAAHEASLVPIDEDLETVSADNLRYTTNEVSRQYLASTDWYVSRNSETGKPIPEDVSVKREEARNLINTTEEAE